MVPAIHMAITGIQTNTLRMDIAAHDIANVNTPGFAQSDPLQTEASSGTGTQIAAIRRTPNPSSEFSNTELARELGLEATIAQTAYSANLQVIRFQDEMLGNIIDIRR